MIQKNNWYALSGVASSGKTTIINELEKRGHKVLHESATEFVKLQIQKGFTIEQLRKNEAIFQDVILELKVFYESMLEPEDTVFIDRGIPDTVAFYKQYNIPMSHEARQKIANASYQKVFLFDRLPLVNEDFRPEPEDEIAAMDKLNRQAYRELNHTILQVPVMPIEQRLQFILNNI